LSRTEYRHRDSELTHSGVKGMKWGVHRSAGSTGSRDAGSEDFARTQASAKRVAVNKGTHVLSNKELQDLVTRMNLEQQYSRLTADQRSSSKAKKFLNSAQFVGRTTNEVISFVNSPAGKLIRKAVLKG
jgi:hypothetical protein